jgi:hypothetical protein
MTFFVAEHDFVSYAHTYSQAKSLCCPQLKMASEESLVTLKILMIGPSGAGKSARKATNSVLLRSYANVVVKVLIRYCDDQFDSESSTATIGVDFKVLDFSTCFEVHAYLYKSLKSSRSTGRHID